MTRRTRLENLLVTLLVTLTMAALLPLGCGGEEARDGELGSLEQAYKHGPPPGAPPYDYFLTSYGGSADPAANGTPACGGKKVDGTWYYATGAYTYGCNTRLRLRANGKCVVVAVVDNGPAGWVETKAQSKCGGTGYIIDASPLVSKYLYGTSSAGWSDCLAIQVTPVAPDTKTGPQPCEAGGQEPGPGPEPAPPPTHTGFIGDPCGGNEDCSTGLCLTEHDFGFPGGMCSQECTHVCPDHPGKPITFCVRVPWDQRGFCHSRRDEAIHPMNPACQAGDPEACGCREGYRSMDLTRFDQPDHVQPTCVPAGHNYSPFSGTSKGNALDDGSGGSNGVIGGCSVSGAGNGSPALVLLLLLGLVARRR